MFRISFAGSLIGLLSSLVSLGLCAQNYPAKPVKLVVPYTAGGSASIIGRTLAQRLTVQMNHPVIVENRGGAAAQVGTEYVIRAAPDGYTILQGNVGPITIAPALFQKLNFDPVKDLAPVTLLGSVDSVVAVTASLPVNTISELVAYSKANPGKVNFTSTGIGSSTHLTGELLRMRAGIVMAHISYKGSAQAETDLIAGRTQVYFGNLPSVVPHLKAGKLRALATTAATRSKALPDVPTVMEVGFPDFDMVSWQAIFAPAGTRREIINFLNSEIRKAVQSPEVMESYARLGVDIAVNSPEELSAYVRKEQAKWGGIVRGAGIKAELLD
jgi:tripartite-type tricarboxylate transporter receptor subunit TctC